MCVGVGGCVCGGGWMCVGGWVDVCVGVGGYVPVHINLFLSRKEMCQKHVPNTVTHIHTKITLVATHFQCTKLGCNIDGGYVIEPGSTEVAFHPNSEVEGLEDEILGVSILDLTCLMTGN